MQNPLNAEAGSILVFIDETGHEEFADPKHPVFGLGGCLFPPNGSIAIVDEPWLKLKRTHFPDYVTRPFHVAAIPSVPTVMQQISRLLSGVALTAIHIIWEDSQRLNNELGSGFGQLWFASSCDTKIPLTYSVLPKHLRNQA